MKNTTAYDSALNPAISVCDVVGGVHEACVVAVARIQVEIEYFKNELVVKDYGYKYPTDHLVSIGYRHASRRLVVFEKILADLVKAQAGMATGQSDLEGSLQFCRYGDCSE